MHPISALELTKSEVVESSMSHRTYATVLTVVPLWLTHAERPCPGDGPRTKQEGTEPDKGGEDDDDAGVSVVSAPSSSSSPSHKSVDRYFIPLSQMTAHTVLPPSTCAQSDCSTFNAAAMFAPPENPPKMPSSFARRLAVSVASASLTVMHPAIRSCKMTSSELSSLVSSNF